MTSFENSIIGSFSVEKCECCGVTGDVKRPESMTQYHTELPCDHPDNPNLPPKLCADCRERYTEYWTEMWAEYNASRL